MKTKSVKRSPATGTLSALREEVARLTERISALELSLGARSPSPAPAGQVSAPAAPAPIAPKVKEEMGEELLLVISAAVAAFLGKKPTIRQIRLIGTGAWAEQGRVSIQASRALVQNR